MRKGDGSCGLMNTITELTKDASESKPVIECDVFKKIGKSSAKMIASHLCC